MPVARLRASGPKAFPEKASGTPVFVSLDERLARIGNLSSVRLPHVTI
jgi:hypothetical protein